MSRLSHSSVRVAAAAACALCMIACAVAQPAELAARQTAMLDVFARRDLPAEQRAETWVDVERWSVAHACMTRGVRLEEANRYFQTVSWVALWRGLIADTDVQVTDLLRSYLAFRDDPRMSDAARAHLRAMFAEWTVPNPDRNRDADRTYDWPFTYTENHSLNILVAAYLIDEALGRDRTASRALLQRYLQDRARWGWSEFHSPQYAMTTTKPLVCLVDFAPDRAVADAAAAMIDLLALEYANQCAGLWRGVPFVRGARMRFSNAQNSFNNLARLWFDPRDDAADAPGDPFVVHLLTSRYRPPTAAVDMVRGLDGRGTYTMQQTMTTGVERTRVPIVAHVTPRATMASAQGYGAYYDGGYWMISFASDPARVITGEYPGGRNILQVDQVLCTFGEVTWRGAFETTKDGAITVGTDGGAWVAQHALGEQCHVLMIADRDAFADAAAVVEAVRQLDASFADGVVAWRMPDGRAVRMVNVQHRGGWMMTGATIDGAIVQPDSNMLYDSPYLRSVRGSGVVEVLHGGRVTRYDLSDIARPTVRQTDQRALTPLPEPSFAVDIGLTMRYVGPGEFAMGAPMTEGRGDEQPQHWRKTSGYYISTTEVTVGMYKAFLADTADIAPPPDWYSRDWGRTDAHPQTYVTWHEARAFCDWLSERTGRRFALPAEAQWEKAAKGYNGHRRYPWGEAYDGSQSGTPNGEYAPVAAKPSDVSPFGLFDMAGNAWEWCADTYDPDAYARHVAGKPAAEAGDEKSLRGCGWNFDPATFRCSYRSSLAADERSVHIGFRVVCDAP
mgnify:CR=1 FL=1